jgi:methylated-DNA-[protein]-cysteine S-methyltransferase
MLGQSAVPTATCVDSLVVSVFETELGWIGMAGQGRKLHSLVLGYDSDDDALAQFAPVIAAGGDVEDWNPPLRRRIETFLAGRGSADFRDVDTIVTESSPFAARVIAAVRSIPPGQVRSYMQIAAQCGSPRAPRAVGNLMARNTIPLVIPCHRVVASGGRLGGYSSPRGLGMKSRLLALEGVSDRLALKYRNLK